MIKYLVLVCCLSLAAVAGYEVGRRSVTFDCAEHGLIVYHKQIFMCMKIGELVPQPDEDWS